MNRAYKFRIYPNKEQTILLSKTFGCCRFLYNTMLSDKIREYRNFFQNPKIGFPRFKSRHKNQNSYTTNVVNGNIALAEGRLKLPKLQSVLMSRQRYRGSTMRCMG